MADDVVRVRSVRPAGDRTLRVLFAGQRQARDVDLTGLIARSRHLAPLMQDEKAFARIEVIEDGLGVAWSVETKWGRLDISASALRRIAEEQQG
ncbi:MAG: hypothetical protein ACHQAY_27605 [Hyphomicrobiales bacterium]